MYSNKHQISEPLRKQPLGDTADGAEWALKALHPADDTAKVEGMPTYDATSVVNLTYLSENIVSPNDAITSDTYDVDIWFLRDPLTFAAVQVVGTDGSGLQNYSIGNEQLGSDYISRYNAMRDLAEAYRVSFAGLTGHLNAPALADQGTVRAAQYTYPSAILPVTAGRSGTDYMYAHIDPRALVYCDPLIPYKDLIQMPKTYTDLAKEGFYMPLKMGPGDENWINTNERILAVGRVTEFDNMDNFAVNYTPEGPRWPWYENTPGIRERARYTWKIGDVIGHIAFRGISTAASVQLIFRIGVDMKVRPSTRFSPFIHDPPVYDQTAIKMYFEIARRMADAYPASYNSTGALIEVVSGIAREIWPMILPHAQQLLKKMMDSLARKVKVIADRRQKQPKAQPAAQAPQAQPAPAKKPLPPRPAKKA